MPDEALQTAYDEATRRGLFTGDKDFQFVGHELRRRGMVAPDPSQGGLFSTGAPATVAPPQMVSDQYGEMRQASQQPVAAPPQGQVNIPPMVGIANGTPLLRQPEDTGDAHQDSQNFQAMNAATQQFESGKHPYIVQSRVGFAYHDPASGTDKFFDMAGKPVSREQFR